MTVTLNSQDRAVFAGTFGAVDAISGGTATAIQSPNVGISITTLAGSTATTSFGQHKIVLTGASGAIGGSSATTIIPVEGMEKLICMLATGPGWKVAIESLATGFLDGFFTTSSDDQTHYTPTGAFVMTTRDHFLQLKYFNERWHVLAGQATIATTT